MGGQIGVYLKSKFKTLLLPYLFLSFLFLLIDPVLWFKECEFAPSQTLQTLLAPWHFSSWATGVFTRAYFCVNDILQGKSMPMSGPLWFVFTLFFASILFHIFLCFLSKIKGKALSCCIVAYGLLALFGSWVFYERQMRLPFSIDCVMCASAFYCVGYLMRDFILNKLNRLSWQTSILLTLVSLAAYIFGFITNGRVGLNANLLGGHFLPGFVLGAFGGIFFTIAVISFASSISLMNKLMYPLRIMATNAIMILALHFFILMELIVWFPNNSRIMYLCMEFLGCALLIPLFNKYLYFLIGKKKSSFSY